MPAGSAISTMQEFLHLCTSEPQEMSDGSIFTVYSAAPQLINRLHLEDNTGVNKNRRVHINIVTEFARRMRANDGSWEPLTSEPIVYNDIDGHDRYGSLVSGQHRLLAAAKAEYTLKFFAWGGKTEGDLSKTDLVIRRTHLDTAAIMEGIDQRYATLLSKVYSYWQLANGYRFTLSGCGCYSQARGSKIGNDVRRHFSAMQGVLEQRFCQEYKEQLCRAFIVFLRIGGASQPKIQRFTAILCSPIEMCPTASVTSSYKAHLAYQGDGCTRGMFLRIIHMWNSFCTNRIYTPDSDASVLGIDAEKISSAFD